jgi:Rrf2 family cysteine metabolism transcriptional repressor
MKIPTMLRYGVRMVVTLAQKGEMMNTEELAKEMGVSALYLRQLASPLERAGILQGIRGAKGGYLLTANPREMTLAEITQAFNEDFSLLDCIKDSDLCPKSPGCTTRYLWEEMSNELKNILQNMTLQELIERGTHNNTGATAWAEYII